MYIYGYRIYIYTHTCTKSCHHVIAFPRLHTSAALAGRWRRRRPSHPRSQGTWCGNAPPARPSRGNRWTSKATKILIGIQPTPNPPKKRSWLVMTVNMPSISLYYSVGGCLDPMKIKKNPETMESLGWFIFSPPSRWGSLDFNKGTTPPPSSSFSPRSPSSSSSTFSAEPCGDLGMQWATPGPEHHITISRCCGPRLCPNTCKRECRRTYVR